MSSLFKIGQSLRGKWGQYVITKSIRESVWLGKNIANEEVVVIKSVLGHPRIANERDVLLRFQDRSPYIRRMIDEIEDPKEPLTIVLKHLDDDMQNVSNKNKLNRKEIRYVAKRILQALSVLHEDKYIHSDLKLDNVLVNFKDGAAKDSTSDVRFTDVQISDFGGTAHTDHEWMKENVPHGAPVWRSPDSLLKLPVGLTTATDIWAFGLCVVVMIYGQNFHPLRPKGSRPGDEDYEFKVIERQFTTFGPFSRNYQDLFGKDPDISAMIIHLYDDIPRDEWYRWKRASSKEVSQEDKDFVDKIMKLDPRDRPTAKALLQDPWFEEVNSPNPR